MPAVKISTRLKLDENISFLDGHELSYRVRIPITDSMKKTPSKLPRGFPGSGTPEPEAKTAYIEDLEQALAYANAKLSNYYEKFNSLESLIEATKEKNAALRRIIHHNPTVTFSCRVEEGWPVVFVAENVSRFGYTPEDFYSGRVKYTNIIHPEDRQRVVGEMRNDSRDQSADKFIYSYRIITSEGRVVWIDHHTWIHRAPDGEVTHLEGALLDITDRKSAETALMESESKFRHLTEESLVGVYIIQEGRFKYVNPKFAQMFGYRPDEMVDKIRPDILVLPEDLPFVTQNLKKRLDGEVGSMQYEFRAVTRDKRIIDVEVFGSRTRFNMQPAVIGSMLDITARKQTEKKLRLTQYAVDHSATAIFRIDPDASITYANQAATHLLGYTEQELLAMTIPDIDPQWTREFWELQGLPMLRKNRVNRFESEHIRKDGTRYPVAVTCYLAEFEDAEQYYAFFSDISARKRTEAEIQRHREHLEELVQERTFELTVAKEQAEVANQAKSEFLANMSHEIRTPLNGVIGMLNLLQDAELTPVQQDFADTAASSATALLNIINDILDFSKIEAGKLDFEVIDFDLRKIMEDLTDMLDIQAQEKGLEITCFVDPQVPKPLRGDPWRLRQVLLNLATNALKFTSIGEVNIHAAVKSCAPTETELYFAVTDSGIGVPKTLSHRLFRPFSQVDSSTTRKFGGTGLGLAICKKLVDLMDGRIGVESRPGQGSKFWFTARLGVPAPNQGEPDPWEADTRLENKSILIVDDSAANRDILEAYLQACRCEAWLAADGDEALELMVRAARAQRPFDLVLIDARMPSVDGQALGRAIRSHAGLQATPMVLLMGRGRGKDWEEARKAGFNALVNKPVKLSGLKDTLLSVLGHRSHEPSPALEKNQAPEDSAGRLQGRILLAEDNPINQKLAVHILEKLGHDIDAVANGRLALEALERRHYDLILMDIQMPEMNGYEATRSIRRREQDARHPAADTSSAGRADPGLKVPRPTDDMQTGQAADRRTRDRIPIIAMTAHAMSGDREKCLEAGMDDYIAKPVDADILTAKLAHWLQKENS
jgi:PAS domain S-box-containing protein